MACTTVTTVPLVQVDDVGSVYAADNNSEKPAAVESSPTEYSVSTSGRASLVSSSPTNYTKTKAASAQSLTTTSPTDRPGLIGFGEGFGLAEFEGDAEPSLEHACKRARIPVRGCPKLPIYIADTRARVPKLMRIIEQQERTIAAQEAGGFVIRVCPYMPMSEEEICTVASSRRIWTRQRFVATQTQGAHHLKVTNLNNKGLNGDPSAFIDKNKYWKGLSSTSSIYSHDFTSALHSKFIPWDMNNIIDSENFLPKVMPESCPGINTTFGYLGQAASTFAWHVEDACLGSMNVNLGGATKVWYTLSPKHQQRFRTRVLRKAFLNDFNDCLGFDQHKQCVVSPDCAEDIMRIPNIVHTHDQEPGDIVITLPGAFHSGFSTGMNFGEAINWGTADWIRAFEYPPNSPCKCRPNLSFDERLWRRMRCQLLI